MKPIINLYKQLILLRISPEALPYSPLLLNSLIASYFLINVAVFLGVGGFALWHVLLANAAFIFIGIAFVFLFLKIKNMEIRLHKILLALFGVDLFFLILSLIIQPISRIGQDLHLIIAFALLLWSLSIKTYIFAQGLGLKRIVAVFMVINFEIIRHLPILALLFSYQ